MYRPGHNNVTYNGAKWIVNGIINGHDVNVPHLLWFLSSVNIRIRAYT